MVAVGVNHPQTAHFRTLRLWRIRAYAGGRTEMESCSFHEVALIGSLGYLYSFMKISYNGNDKGLIRDWGLMIKHVKMKKVLFRVVGFISLMALDVLAETKDFSLKQCKISLEQDSLRLKAYSKQQENQVIYDNLYQQIQNFLRNPENPNNPAQSGKCHNFINTIDSIVGKQPRSKDLAPMPVGYSNSQMGKLTSPTLETAPKRPLAPLSIRYVDAPQASLSPGEDDIEEIDATDKLTSNSTPLPSAKKTHLKEREFE
jgi:hypothetical protein